MTPADRRAALIEKVAKAICREQCAFYGEPPCWALGDDYVQEPWPPDCGEPGCMALATAAINLIRAEVLEEAAKIVESTPFVYTIRGTPPGSIEVVDSSKTIAAAIRALKTPA